MSFEDNLLNVYRKLIQEEMGAAPPADPGMAPPADPGMAPPPPADPGMAPPPADPGGAPEEPEEEPDQHIGGVLKNLGLVSSDAFSEWVENRDSKLTPQQKSELKNAYSGLYDFLRLYKDSLKIIETNNKDDDTEVDNSIGDDNEGNKL